MITVILLIAAICATAFIVSLMLSCNALVEAFEADVGPRPMLGHVYRRDDLHVYSHSFLGKLYEIFYDRNRRAALFKSVGGSVQAYFVCAQPDATTPGHSWTKVTSQCLEDCDLFDMLAWLHKENL